MDSILGLAIVIATFAGPIGAVIVTRLIDRKRAQRDRQLDVFRALMRTRKGARNPTTSTRSIWWKLSFTKLARYLPHIAI
jgi:hypothetical protein